MKIAVIGAGSAGLAALRHCTSRAYHCEVVCYEKTEQVGGLWVYREETDLDQYGLPVHSSMYKSLRTNLPKEIMGYPDYDVPDYYESFIPRTKMLDFLNSYCDHFQLRQHIRFLHVVELVKPININGNQKWSITVKDLQKNFVSTELFDAVMVSNGHFFEPSVPILKGQSDFRGQQTHSHVYRTPEKFTDKIVVVVGGGPSALDLAMETTTKAKRVFLSNHVHEAIGTVFPENLVQKPDIAELTESTVNFKDDTSESVDIVLYCTGYKYSYPFLSEKCGVQIDSNMLTPLWKQIISIENPTLMFIGLPSHVTAFNMFDLQVRFALKYLFGLMDLPSKEDMLQSEKDQLEKMLQEGFQKRHFHILGSRQGEYFDDIAKTAEITPIRPVITKLFNQIPSQLFNNFTHFREFRYRILNDLNFIILSPSQS